jgi:hypothetical protein
LFIVTHQGTFLYPFRSVTWLSTNSRTSIGPDDLYIPNWNYIFQKADVVLALLQSGRQFCHTSFLSLLNSHHLFS